LDALKVATEAALVLVAEAATALKADDANGGDGRRRLHISCGGGWANKLI